MMREMFDAQALFLALDAQREERSLTWPGVARELWEMSSELAKLRGEDHPFAASTLTNLTKRGDTSCQHALFMLRWLGRDPEDFVPGAPASTRAALPSAGPDRRLRWHLQRRELPDRHLLHRRRVHLRLHLVQRLLHRGEHVRCGDRPDRVRDGRQLMHGMRKRGVHERVMRVGARVLGVPGRAAGLRRRLRDVDEAVSILGEEVSQRLVGVIHRKNHGQRVSRRRDVHVARQVVLKRAAQAGARRIRASDRDAGPAQQGSGRY